MDKIKNRLQLIYPDSYESVCIELEALIAEYRKKIPKRDSASQFFSEKDIILICYADHVQEPNTKTLKTMHKFLNKFVKGYINKVHFLPFYPYSSDDGFSVIDYYKVKEDFGDWTDIDEINKDFGLMFDLVINHVSAKSEWFKKFLEGDKEYKNWFIAFDKEVDTSAVFRPRAHPLLTPFDTKMGKKYVWTTFSDDQIDLNFENPKVLLEMLKVLLFYIEHGAEVIRLDAITYFWKKLGTNSIHLEQTHEAVKIMHDLLLEVAPYVWIITETNVPHKENISYFGNGTDEAHLVYNFTLPPLLLYSVLNEDTTILTKWAQTLETPSQETTFFNFTASHDGIGVTPLKGIIPDEDIQKLADFVLKNEGKVNYRAVAGSAPQPYELNIVYHSALGNTEAFLASQAIELALRGVPAVYFNSLIGAKNWTEGIEKLGHNRAINRQKFDYDTLQNELKNDQTVKGYVYSKYKTMLTARINEPLFHPTGNQKIIALSPKIFAVIRSVGEKKLLALTNITKQAVEIKGMQIYEIMQKDNVKDILTKKEISLIDSLVLNPFETYWLK